MFLFQKFLGPKDSWAKRIFLVKIFLDQINVMSQKNFVLENVNIQKHFLSNNFFCSKIFCVQKLWGLKLIDIVQNF